MSELLTSRIDEVMVPLAPDEATGFRQYHQFRGSTRNAEFLSCHVSVLTQGCSPHPPHTHAEEEILMMLDGEADLVLPHLGPSDETQTVRLAPGQLVYYPADFPHTLRAVSARPANYLMFKWLASSGHRSQLPFGRFDLEDSFSAATPGVGFDSRVVLEGSTGCLDKLHAHATTLAPGAGYDAHVDSHDVAIVVLQGEVETLHRRVGPHGIIFYASGQPHGMHNPGSQPARYVAFEFHGRVPFLRLVADPRHWKRTLRAAWRR